MSIRLLTMEIRILRTHVHSVLRHHSQRSFCLITPLSCVTYVYKNNREQERVFVVVLTLGIQRYVDEKINLYRELVLHVLTKIHYKILLTTFSSTFTISFDRCLDLLMPLLLAFVHRYRPSHLASTHYSIGLDYLPDVSHLRLDDVLR